MKDLGGERVSRGIMKKVEIGNSVTLQLRVEKIVKKSAKISWRER